MMLFKLYLIKLTHIYLTTNQFFRWLLISNVFTGAPQAGYGAPGAMPGQYQQPGAMPGQYQQPGAMPGQYQQPGTPYIHLSSE